MCEQCDCERRLECLRIAADVNEGAPADFVLQTAREFADFVFMYEPGEYDGPDDDDFGPPKPDVPPPDVGPEMTDDDRSKIRAMFPSPWTVPQPEKA